MKWKQRVMTSFTIKHTRQMPVDNCDKGIQSQDRDRANFASHQGSATAFHLKNRLTDSYRNVWNVTRNRGSAIDISNQSVSTVFLKRPIDSFLECIKPPEIDAENFVQFRTKYGLSRGMWYHDGYSKNL